MNDIISLLRQMQLAIKCPKKKKNEYAGYMYRTCDDIMEAANKAIPEACSVGVSDEVVLIGERYYVKATASFLHAGQSIDRTGYAREPLVKKGQDEPQITGTASSYARKLALSGLLMLDDGVDDDATNMHIEPMTPPGKPIEGLSVIENLRNEIKIRQNINPSYKRAVEVVLTKKDKKLNDLDEEGLEWLLKLSLKD
jgi:hypothetical protein